MKYQIVVNYQLKLTLGILMSVNIRNIGMRLHKVEIIIKKDPLLVQLAGGPGCSLTPVFIAGTGPCTFKMDGSGMEYNEYAWDKRLNVLYIESLAGVGYNPAKSKDDIKYNDFLSAEENLEALLSFFSKFPEYKKNDMYILGISYGGIYTPNLAARINQYNKVSEITGDFEINLKGITIGNGATDWESDIFIAYHQMAYHHNIINKQLHETLINNTCKWYFWDVKPSTDTPVCKEAIEKFKNLTADVNWYDIYSVTEGEKLKEPKIGETIIGGEKRYYNRGYRKSDYVPWMQEFYGPTDPIVGDFMSDYLNREDVRHALHIPDDVQPWEGCRRDDWFDYKLQPEGSVYLYPLLKSLGLRILVFSGDVDGCVPTFGTESWIKKLKWDTTEDWHPWFIDNQVVGFKKKFDGLDFTTVRGAGHGAPLSKPEASMKMIMGFVLNEDY
jgi:serine carboxypeptidase-like clade 2